jgi:hypothetical protein
MPWVLSMGGSGGVRLGYEPNRSRLYVRIPADENMAVPPNAYSQLDISLRQDETGSVFEVATSSSKYFREFHRFATLLAEEYESSAQTAVGAFHSAIRGWQELVSSRGILTPEQQVGLFGELLVLHGLLRRHGTDAVLAWIGRGDGGSNRHDFRTGKLDLEVKTARTAARRHFIHGLGQLVPAPDHDLYLLSIRLEAAGSNAGRSLPEQITSIRRLMRTRPSRAEEFDRKLRASDYRDDDQGFYEERLILSDEPRLISVGDHFPRVTRAMLDNELPNDVSNRIEEVSYIVNLEGLGTVAGSDRYEAVLPNVSITIE